LWLRTRFFGHDVLPVSSHAITSPHKDPRRGAASFNYEEARGAESRADFVHKVRIATKELREAHYWLRVVQRLFVLTYDILRLLALGA
jgi:hypothetical protein